MTRETDAMLVFFAMSFVSMSQSKSKHRLENVVSLKSFSLWIIFFFSLVGFSTRLKFTIHSLRFNSFATKWFWPFRFSIWILYVSNLDYLAMGCVMSSLYEIFTLFVQEFQDMGVDITIGITEFLLGMTNLLIYCYLGKLANESYAQMPDCMFYMNWYELPAGLQKFFILMIGNMQKALYYRGFGFIVLNLETFTRVSVHPFQISCRSLII